MKFVCKTFSELSTQELFDIYHLRAMVFVVEQNCAYQDVDEHDLKAFHFMIWRESKLLGYSRIIPPDQQHNEPKIGRVVVHSQHRRLGLATQVMVQSIKICGDKFPGNDIVISAQTYLEGFYTDLGFNKEGAVYDEDGIPHQKMRYKGAIA